MNASRVRCILGLWLAVMVLGGLLLGGPKKPVNPPPPPLDPAIVYQLDVGDGTGIMLMNADGTNPLVLVDGSSGFRNVNPSWAPDGCRIMFMSDMDGANGMYHINVDGTGLSSITPMVSINTLSRGDWSVANIQTGQEWIAYSQDDLVVGVDLFLVRPDGSNRVQLTDTLDRLECNPVWAPDGQRLAVWVWPVYWVDGEASYDIHASDVMVFDLDFIPDGQGSYDVGIVDEINLTAGTGLHGEVRIAGWAHSADSLVVYYDYGLWRIDLYPDGSMEYYPLIDTTTTLFRVDNGTLSWSEDDQWIVYEGYMIKKNNGLRLPNSDGIYIVPADGSADPVRILEGGTSPDWRPAKCPE